MALGICLKGMNSYFFKRWLDFFFEFIPQITMLLLLFGYMDFLIIAKWLTDYNGKENEAPSILTTMINIPLKSGEIEG